MKLFFPLVGIEQAPLIVQAALQLQTPHQCTAAPPGCPWRWQSRSRFQTSKLQCIVFISIKVNLPTPNPIVAPVPSAAAGVAADGALPPVTNWTPLLQPLAKATQLRSLRLSKNDIAFLPDCVGDIASLHLLDVSSNRLTQLPPLSKMTSLVHLDASNNRLVCVPHNT